MLLYIFAASRIGGCRFRGSPPLICPSFIPKQIEVPKSSLKDFFFKRLSDPSELASVARGLVSFIQESLVSLIYYF